MTATTSPSSQPAVVKRPAGSEELLNEKWDQCLSNLVVKAALGAGFGIVFSVLLFKRRAWPATFGLGVGAGRGYAECDREFRNAASGGSVTEAVKESLRQA